MSNTTTTWHSIREASMISGLPESTLRYYEQIGIIDPIARDPSSGHRVYSDKDIESLTTIACLESRGPAHPAGVRVAQIALLARHRRRTRG